MSQSTWDGATVAPRRRALPLSEEDRAELTDFLASVANSTLKVKILRLFLSDPGLCLSSPSLAERVGASIFEIRRAAQQLADEGALNYCPHFAFSDLCHLSLSRLPQPVQSQLKVLITALRCEPDLVWGYFDNENSA